MEDQRRSIIIGVAALILLVAGAGVAFLLYQSSQAPKDASAAGLVGCVVDNPSVTDSYLKIANEERCAGLTIERYQKQMPAGTTSADCVGTSENRSTIAAIPGQTYYPEGSCGLCVQIDAHDGNRPHGTAKYTGDCSDGGGDDGGDDPPPNEYCGDAICQTGELCEESKTAAGGSDGSKACLPGDLGKMPTGQPVPACTFSGANACKQAFVELKCADSCVLDGQCPSGTQCHEGVCTENECMSEGNCTGPCTPVVTPPPNPQCGDGVVDSGEECNEPGLSCPTGGTCNTSTCTCNPTTTEKKQCGESCANSSECPTGNVCNANGVCVMETCNTNSSLCNVDLCSLKGQLPATAISGEDLRVILFGLLIMLTGFVAYKTGILQQFTAKMLGPDAQTNIFDYLNQDKRQKQHERKLISEFEGQTQPE